MKLEGSLDMFPLRELVEMTVYSSVTGVLNIFGAQGTGQIFFRNGQAYHAAYGGAVGVHAVIALLDEPPTTFSFVGDSTSDRETLWGDPLDLIDNAERIATRWKRIRKYVPSLDVIPCALCPAEYVQGGMIAEHWSIFAAIDGQRTLADIIQALNFEPVEVCEAIAQMCEENLIELRCADTPDLAGEADLGAERQSQKSGVLDRLLAGLSPETSQSTDPAPSHPPDPPAIPGPSANSRRSSEEDKILRLLRS